MHVDVLIADGRLGEIELIERGADGDADRALRCCRRGERSRQGRRDNNTPHVVYLRTAICLTCAVRPSLPWPGFIRDWAAPLPARGRRRARRRHRLPARTATTGGRARQLARGGRRP